MRIKKKTKKKNIYIYIYIYILTDSYNLVSKFFVIVTKRSLKMENIQLSFGDKTKEIQPYATSRT